MLATGKVIYDSKQMALKKKICQMIESSNRDKHLAKQCLKERRKDGQNNHAEGSVHLRVPHNRREEKKSE